MKKAIVFPLVIALMLFGLNFSGCSVFSIPTAEGAFITNDVANMFSSFLPELDLYSDMSFSLRLGMNAQISGTYEKAGRKLILKIMNNSTDLPAEDFENLALTVRNENTVVLNKEISGFTKAGAVFNKATGTDSEVKHSYRGSKKGVDDFIKLSGVSGKSEYCFNITTEELATAGYSVFKYGDDCASYLVYNGKAYQMGEYGGGYGVMDMKTVDPDKDGKMELIYTYSWGSGLHRSHVGYFEPDKEEMQFPSWALLNEDTGIFIEKNGKVSIYKAKISIVGTDFVDYDVYLKEYNGSLSYLNGRVTVGG